MKDILKEYLFRTDCDMRYCPYGYEISCGDCNDRLLEEHDEQVRVKVIEEILTLVNLFPKDCDCDYDLREKVDKVRLIEAIEKLKEQK